ncbi:LPXTG-motif cell wall-anchored protein [Streptococcus rupicaprae]|uniref:LPXTG-motif cell wall-anchored protein n=1 Tax=Streptococcus rupicaprae TaxID=759619 RepID=A0ABV2FIZ4_9STRE
MLFDNQKCYSIRKLKVGVGSVLVGTLIIGLPTQFVQADGKDEVAISSPPSAEIFSHTEASQLKEEQPAIVSDAEISKTENHTDDTKIKGSEISETADVILETKPTETINSDSEPVATLEREGNDDSTPSSSQVDRSQPAEATLPEITKPKPDTTLLPEGSTQAIEEISLQKSNGENSKKSTTARFAYRENEQETRKSVEYQTVYHYDKTNRTSLPTHVEWVITFNKEQHSWTKPNLLIFLPKGVVLPETITEQEQARDKIEAEQIIKLSDFDTKGTNYRWRSDYTTNRNKFESEWQTHVSYASGLKGKLSIEDFQTVLINKKVSGGLDHTHQWTYKIKVGIPSDGSIDPYNLPFLAGINQLDWFTYYYRFVGEVPNTAEKKKFDDNRKRKQAEELLKKSEAEQKDSERDFGKIRGGTIISPILKSPKTEENPSPVPKPTPKPDSEKTPKPEVMPEGETMPTPKPKPDSEKTPEPETKPEGETKPVPEPKPEVMPEDQTKTVPELKPDSEKTPKPEAMPEDQTKRKTAPEKPTVDKIAPLINEDKPFFDPEKDHDGDGFTSRQELDANTDPLDPKSFPQPQKEEKQMRPAPTPEAKEKPQAENPQKLPKEKEKTTPAPKSAPELKSQTKEQPKETTPKKMVPDLPKKPAPVVPEKPMVGKVAPLINEDKPFFDPEKDHDGDGFTSRQELDANTDPLDPKSFPQPQKPTLPEKTDAPSKPETSTKPDAPMKPEVNMPVNNEKLKETGKTKVSRVAHTPKATATPAMQNTKQLPVTGDLPSVLSLLGSGLLGLLGLAHIKKNKD